MRSLPSSPSQMKAARLQRRSWHDDPGIDRDVGFGPGEPLVMHAIHSSTLSHFRDHESWPLIPKIVGILQGAGTFSLPVFLDNVTVTIAGAGTPDP